MKKFAFFYYGFETPTQEIMDAWNYWFASIADKMVDNGSGLGPGREISHNGTKELPLGIESLTGYNIINAENLDDAEIIAQSCPLITSVRVRAETESTRTGRRRKRRKPANRANRRKKRPENRSPGRLPNPTDE